MALSNPGPIAPRTLPTGGPPLDHFQVAAVAEREASSLLLRSCAGSGKSTVLAARALALTERGLAPSQLCVLTFSVKSANDLQAKLSALMPGTGRAPTVKTHHAHALSILRRAGSTARVVDSAAQRKLVKAALMHTQRASEPPSRECVTAALTFLGRAKSQGLDALPRGPGTPERALFDAYEAGLRNAGCIDFEDMILRATTVLRQEAADAAHTGQPLAHGWRGPSHLMLDEAQDTSLAQFELLQYAAPRQLVALTAVGDADQTIYSFRGSRPDVMSLLAAHWGCKTLVLPTNYRCGAAIVDAARWLIERSTLRESIPLLAAPRNICGLGSVTVAQHATRALELDHIAGGLAAAQRSLTTPAGGVAVLQRTRAQVAEVRAALKARGVRLRKSVAGRGAVGSDGGAARRSANEVLAYLRLLCRPEDDPACEDALRVPSRTGFGAGGAGLSYLRAAQAEFGRGLGGGTGGGMGLLRAAQAVAARAFPSLRVSFPPSASAAGGQTAAASLALTKPQQSALRSFLQLVGDAAKLASSYPPCELVQALAEKVNLVDHVERSTRAQTQTRRAFTVRVAGGRAHSGGEGSDSDEGSGSSSDGGGGGGGGGVGVGGSVGQAAVDGGHL